jgi:hypothetical protein
VPAVGRPRAPFRHFWIIFANPRSNFFKKELRQLAPEGQEMGAIGLSRLILPFAFIRAL